MFDNLVSEELNKARRFHPNKFHSEHEGLAIIEEEFLELREEVFTKNKDIGKIQKELIQLATMCRRFYEDLYVKSETTPVVEVKINPIRNLVREKMTVAEMLAAARKDRKESI